MLNFVDKKPSPIFARKRLLYLLFNVANRINDQTVVLGADVDAIKLICKIARAKGLDAFVITEFGITTTIDVSELRRRNFGPFICS